MTSKSAHRLFGSVRPPNPLRHPATPATPAAPASKRCPLLAKIHIAKVELGLAEDDYRAILIDVAGVDSAAKLSTAQRGAVLDRFAARGWKPARGGKAPGAKPRRASSPVEAKARALWISLHHLGVVADGSENALLAFAKRQLGVDRFEWIDQRKGYRLIEALKAMAQRHGWDQGTEGVPSANVTRMLRHRLITTLMGKLRACELVPASWDAARAVREFSGNELHQAMMLWSDSELDRAAKVLGDTLREHGPARAEVEA